VRVCVYLSNEPTQYSFSIVSMHLRRIPIQAGNSEILRMNEMKAKGLIALKSYAVGDAETELPCFHGNRDIFLSHPVK
jgi:hypothetical protein